MNDYRMEINTTNSQLNISNHIRRFTIKRTSPQMKITRKTPKFKVDWDKVRAESGLKNPKYFMQDTRQRAYSKIMNSIKRMSQEGDMMMDITKDAPDMVPYIAAENMRSALPEVNIASIPESLPDVTWDEGAFEITWTKGSMEIIWDEDYEPDISFTPHSVEIKIRNFKKIRMNDKGNKLEGRKIDRKI